MFFLHMHLTSLILLLLFPVIPAKAGIQCFQLVLDSRFRGNDKGHVKCICRMFLSFSRLKGTAVVLLLFVCLSCAKTPPEVNTAGYVSSARGKFWMPDQFDSITNPPPTAILPNLRNDATSDGYNVGLAELIDTALGNNPKTQMAWEAAKASAADWAVSRGEYYPTIDGEGGVGLQKASSVLVRDGVVGALDLSLSYLLLDFGGRSARIEAARQALIAANWNHNQIIQDLLRDVPRAYSIYIASKAQVSASEKSLDDARVTLESTRLRRKVGVSTIADVLQAEAREAQARVDLIRDQGDVEISRGELARVVGWPANKSFEVGEKLEKLHVGKLTKNVDNLIDQARRMRPDLNSAVANLRKKEAELKNAITARFPRLGATADANLSRDTANFNQSYTGGLAISFPIFHGFALKNQMKKAEAELEKARASLMDTDEDVILDVWNSYYDFRTALRQVDANIDLLRSASEAFKVSLARYKAGAADITELLDAQRTLAEARAELVDARMNLYTSYAELMHSIGSAVPTAYATEQSWPYDELRKADYGRE